MLETLLRAAEYPGEFLLCVVLAALPTFLWLYLFDHHILHRKLWIGLTFLGGMMSAMVILLYQYYWGTQIDFYFFSLEPQNFDYTLRSGITSALLGSVAVYMSIGFIEEFLKHWFVKRIDYRIFESVDEVIEFSIVGALGFAFLENIGYFFLLVVSGETSSLISLFAMRSIFVVFIHILCSGIYGYYYGMAHFSGPYLRSEDLRGNRHWIPELLYKVFHIGRARSFHTEMVLKGLLIAMVVHGLYDLFLHLNLTLQIGGRVIGLHYMMMPLLLIGGYTYLSHLLDKKDLQKHYGYIVEKPQYIRTNRNLQQKPLGIPESHTL